MKFQDIMTKRTFTGKDGSEKTTWLKAGTLRTLDNGKIFVELNHLPDVSFYVFDQKPRENQPTPATTDAGIAWEDR